MITNNIEIDVKTKCIERAKSQAQLAEAIGVTPAYVNRIVKSKEQIVNKTFIAMMEALGYDVQLCYVKREAN